MDVITKKNSKTCENKQKRALEDHDWLTYSFYYQAGQNIKVFIVCTTYNSVFMKKKHFWIE